MIKTTSISLNHVKKTATVALFADTKEDITNDMTIPDLPEGYEVEFGSSVMTASGELAFLKSDGTWNWT